MAFVSLLKSAIRFATVFLFGSTGESISQKSGHLNLGTPGVMCMGAFGGILGVSIVLNATNGNVSGGIGFLCVLVGILFALLFGAICGALFSFFAITLKCNQNVTGLTLTTLGSGLFAYGIKNAKSQYLTRAASAFQNLFPIQNGMNWFTDLFLDYGILVYLAIAVSIVASVVISRTRVGLRLRSVGENPATADASGIDVAKYRYIATMIGCAISALGGLFMIMDYMGGSVEYNLAEYGWLAVCIVISSMWKPSIGIAGSFLFGLLYVLPYKVGLSFSGINFMKLVPYIVTIVILIITSLINTKTTQPPAGLGLTYDREER